MSTFQFLPASSGGEIISFLSAALVEAIIFIIALFIIQRLIIVPIIKRIRDRENYIREMELRISSLDAEVKRLSEERASKMDGIMMLIKDRLEAMEAISKRRAEMIIRDARDLASYDIMRFQEELLKLEKDIAPVLAREAEKITKEISAKIMG